MTGIDQDTEREIQRLTEQAMPAVERDYKDLQRVHEHNERLLEKSNANNQQ